ncbi:MAG: hypothetical protein FJ218_00100 [Ignavibacteria bacterium]|nr:hypothetical protein [Ignavibacteria bacterium]
MQSERFFPRQETTRKHPGHHSKRKENRKYKTGTDTMRREQYSRYRKRSRHINEQGELIQTHGFIIDVTGKKTLEKQFRQAQKLESVGTIAGGIAYDLNNILTIIFRTFIITETNKRKSRKNLSKGWRRSRFDLLQKCSYHFACVERFRITKTWRMGSILENERFQSEN